MSPESDFPGQYTLLQIDGATGSSTNGFHLPSQAIFICVYDHPCMKGACDFSSVGTLNVRITGGCDHFLILEFIVYNLFHPSIGIALLLLDLKENRHLWPRYTSSNSN